MTYFAAYQLGTNSAVMVTGSHNPPDYNGLKMVLGGETLSGDTIQKLRERLVEQRPGTWQRQLPPARHRRRIPHPHRLRRQAGAPDEDHRRLRQRRARRLRAQALSRHGLPGGGTVLRGRRQFPQPSSRSLAAEKPAGPDRRAENQRRRNRPRLRRRRRPPRRGHQGRQHHLPRPPADAVRRRRAQAQPRRRNHFRRQIDAQAVRLDPRARRQARCCGKPATASSRPR